MTQGGSKSLFKVVNVSTAALDEQIADFSLGRQINISYISEYNQTLLQEVKVLVALSPGWSEVTEKTAPGAVPQECLMLTSVRV